MTNASAKTYGVFESNAFLPSSPVRGQMENTSQSALRSNRDQAVYSGIVKKRELRHDAAIYDVYQREARKISKGGAHQNESCSISS